MNLINAGIQYRLLTQVNNICIQMEYTALIIIHNLQC